MEITSYDLLFKILRSVIFDRSDLSFDKSEITSEQLTEIIKLADKHDLGHLVNYAIEKHNLIDKESDEYKSTSKSIMKAIYRYTQQDYVYNQVIDLFEEEGIDFIPLKGAVLRNFYKEAWMRTSCDIDILINEKDLKNAVFLLQDKLEFKSDEKKNYHDISLYSPSGVHLELHFNIQEGIDNLDKVLSKVWEYTNLKEGKKHFYEMSNEFFAFHIIAHMAYHFVKGGCGIRPIMDLFLYNKQVSVNQDELNQLLKNANLVKFYEHILSLSNVWFANKEHNELTIEMERYVLGGGVYGTNTNRITLARQKEGKIKYILSRIFMPYEQLKNAYPIIIKHKWLTPFMQIARWFKLLNPKKAKKSIDEIKISNNIDTDNTSALKNLLDDLEL